MTVFAINLGILGIIAFCGWRGYRNGLIRGVFGVVALIVSIFVANIAAAAYSEEFTDMLTPFVGGIVDSTITEMDENGVEYDPDEHEHENKTEEFGTAYTVLRRIGLPESSAVRIAELSLEDEIEGLFTSLIADKLSTVLAYVAVFAVAFILIAIVFAVIGNLIGFVFSLPGLKLLDSIAGVVFGLAKGLIIVFTLTTIVKYFGLVAPDTVEGASVLNYFINHNPVANMLGL